MFSEHDTDRTGEKENRVRNSKRRKTNTAGRTDSLDDDDDVYYGAVQGKKQKGGIGYAGDQKEDVSWALLGYNKSHSRF